MRSLLAGLLAVLAAASLGSYAHAQTLYGNPTQPPVSPYINILRGGAPAGVNYYNIVQPQLQFYSAINQLQNQQYLQATNLSTNASGDLITGHPIQFSNLSHFYPQSVLGQRGNVIGSGPRTTTNVQNSGSMQNLAQANAPIRPLGTAPTAFPLRPR
jgi:hypothetical protein